MLVAFIICFVFGIFVGIGWTHILDNYKEDAEYCYNCPYLWCDTVPEGEGCIRKGQNDDDRWSVK